MNREESLGWIRVKLIAAGLGALLLAMVATPLLKLTGIVLIADGMSFVLTGVMGRLLPFGSR